MPRHVESRVLPYTTQQLFSLVADVRAYPQFLPWCVGSRVYQETDSQFTADLLIGYKILKEKYTCIVHLEPHKQIYINYLSGPFSKLSNIWTFTPHDNNNCLLNFEIDFMFRGIMLQKLATSLFHEVVHKMVMAFEYRARVIYAT
jgi:coenzyme Q-binding protein COQ10